MEAQPKLRYSYEKQCAVVQWNDVMKYNSSAPVFQSKGVLNANFLKVALYHGYFSKNLNTSSE